MKSSLSSTSTLDWSSPIHHLFRGGKSKIADQLASAGHKTLEDLLWLFPLRVQIIPALSPFDQINIGDYFRGAGKIISHQSKPNFWAKGKGRALLQNINVIVQDLNSPMTLSLRWFNSYSSINEKIKGMEVIQFTGVVQTFNQGLQIANPEFEAYNPKALFQPELKISYPTVNKVSPHHLSQVIEKIPQNLWQQIPDPLPQKILAHRQFLSLGEAFRIIHGKVALKDFSQEQLQRAHDRLIYEEFFVDQIKIQLRREKIKTPSAQKIPAVEKINLQSYFSFDFTEDQKTALNSIIEDLSKPHPMMRLIQGDVGCGKTAIAFASAIHTCHAGFQTAMMCPTESLAYQHYENALKIFPPDIKIALLTGSLKANDKKKWQEKIANGEVHFVIGTHALIQESVQFKNLALAIIDEQHKFGVDQRLKLVSKGEGSHCLILTATPIPRSLSLTQYGDLDITTIKSMPTGRKGHQTRIIDQGKIEKYYSFLKTRLTMGEQAYIVVPAIEESELHDLQNLHRVLEQYQNLFPEYRIKGLHGKLPSEEKNLHLDEFKQHKIDILVATSVIEVGIDIANATVLSIINPDRFGLSSLHQLRGRVGRGDKPGFCFLVAENKISQEAKERLKVIENNTDGFKIAEEDLRIRGEGDLFGKDQSGVSTQKRLANILLHYPQLQAAREDVMNAWSANKPFLEAYIKKHTQDERIFSTI